jgi:hypothetical protein
LDHNECRINTVRMRQVLYPVCCSVPPNRSSTRHAVRDFDGRNSTEQERRVDLDPSQWRTYRREHACAGPERPIQALCWWRWGLHDDGGSRNTAPVIPAFDSIRCQSARASLGTDASKCVDSQWRATGRICAGGAPGGRCVNHTRRGVDRREVATLILILDETGVSGKADLNLDWRPMRTSGAGR